MTWEDEIWEGNECLECGKWLDCEGGFGLCESCRDECQGRDELEACAETPEAVAAAKEAE